jgi:hypothetical protein
MYAAGHTTRTAMHLYDFSFKGIAKRTASRAGVSMFKDLSESVSKRSKAADGTPVDSKTADETPVKKP